MKDADDVQKKDAPEGVLKRKGYFWKMVAPGVLLCAVGLIVAALFLSGVGYGTVQADDLETSSTGKFKSYAPGNMIIIKGTIESIDDYNYTWLQEQYAQSSEGFSKLPQNGYRYDIKEGSKTIFVFSETRLGSEGDQIYAECEVLAVISSTTSQQGHVLLHKEDKSALNGMSIIGLMLSVFGIIMLLMGIVLIRKSHKEENVKTEIVFEGEGDVSGLDGLGLPPMAPPPNPQAPMTAGPAVTPQGQPMAPQVPPGTSPQPQPQPQSTGPQQPPTMR